MIDQNHSADELTRGIDFRANIRQSIAQLIPFINAHSILNPLGFQLDVNAPAIKVRTQDEFAQIMGREPDAFYRLLLSMEGCSVEPQMGLVNIVSQLGKSLEIEYRPKGKGKNFRILFGGQEMRIESTATDEEISQALDIIFLNGKPNINSKTIHISKATVDLPKSLRTYDRDGNLIQP